LLANCCEDVIVPHVLPFVKENIEVGYSSCNHIFGTITFSFFNNFRIQTGVSVTPP
jgi:hypothetical protein